MSAAAPEPIPGGVIPPERNGDDLLDRWNERAVVEPQRARDNARRRARIRGRVARYASMREGFA